MKFRTSKKIFAHIDCDSFFAECEIVKNPNLKNNYVIVGSEIVLACNYKTKSLGIKTGTPVWDAKKILNGKGVFLESDHSFYSFISSKLMSYLQNNILGLEPFSIDEAFCDITGLAEMHGLTLYDYVKMLQSDIKKNIGVPVSIGVSTTRIKSKIFSKLNKPNGIFIDLGNSQELYKKLELSIVPFIGKSSREKLKYKCDNVHDFLDLGFWYIKNNLGKTHSDLWLELKGVNSYVVKKSNFSKSISRGRSFNNNITKNFDFIYKQLIINFNFLFEEFINNNYETKKVIVFFRYIDKKTYFFEQKLAFYTDNRRILLEVVKRLFLNSYDKNNLYRSTGVIFSDLKNNSFHQTDIFEKTPTKNTSLYSIVNEINKKYNNHKITFGSDLLGKGFASKMSIRK